MDGKRSDDGNRMTDDGKPFAFRFTSSAIRHPPSEDFYRTYGLEQYVKSGQLVPVEGDETAVMQTIRQTAKKRVVPQDVIQIGFNSYYRADVDRGPWAVNRGR